MQLVDADNKKSVQKQLTTLKRDIRCQLQITDSFDMMIQNIPFFYCSGDFSKQMNCPNLFTDIDLVKNKTDHAVQSYAVNKTTLEVMLRMKKTEQ